MSRLVQILKIFLSAAFIISSNVYATDIDDGTDANGDLIVSPTLAMRCGLTSKEPNVTSDCISRLAYDYKTGVIKGMDFADFSDMRKTILSEYVASYMEGSLKQLVDASGYEDKINEEMCIDSTKASCSSVSKDTREEIEYNNKMAANNASILMDAVKLRAQELNYNNLETMLYNVVPAKDIDLSDNSLAGPP